MYEAVEGQVSALRQEAARGMFYGCFGGAPRVFSCTVPCGDLVWIANWVSIPHDHAIIDSGVGDF